MHAIFWTGLWTNGLSGLTGQHRQSSVGRLMSSELSIRLSFSISPAAPEWPGSRGLSVPAAWRTKGRAWIQIFPCFQRADDCSHVLTYLRPESSPEMLLSDWP